MEATFVVPGPHACDAATRALYRFDEYAGATVFHDACGVDNVLTGLDGAVTAGFLGIAVTSVSIVGPPTAQVGASVPFAAIVTPQSPTPPLIYTWSPTPVAGQNTPNASYSWSTPGSQVITLTVSNAGSSAVATHTLAITTTSPPLILPIGQVAISGPLNGIRGLSYTFAAKVTPADATQPIVYAWSPGPLSGQGTPLATYNWALGGSQQITVAATNAGGSASAMHAIMIDDPEYDWRSYLPLLWKGR
jgi:hypothetical protein